MLVRLLIFGLLVGLCSSEWCLVSPAVEVVGVKNCPDITPKTKTKLIKTDNSPYRLFPFRSMEQVPSTDGKPLYMCGVRGVQTVYCHEFCLIEKGDCSGDLEFCLNYTCVSEGFAQCHCVTEYFKEVELVSNDGLDWKQALEIIDGNFGFSKNGSPKPRSIKTLELQSDVDPSKIYSFLEGSSLIVRAEFPGKKVIMLNKDDWAQAVEMEDEVSVISLPTIVFVESGTLKVRLYFEKSYIYTTEFEISNKVFCKITNCVMCWEALSNFSCLPSLYKFLVIFSIIVSLMMFLVLFPSVIYSILAMITISIKAVKYSISCFGRIGKMKIVKASTRKMRSVGSKIKSKIGSAISIEEDESKKYDVESPKEVKSMRFPKIKEIEREDYNLIDREENPNDAVSRWMSNRARLNVIIIPLIFFGLIQTTLACSSGLLIPVTIQDCSSEGPLDVCNLSFEVTASIPYPGSETCFTMADLESNVVFANTKIKYDFDTETISLNKLYNTAPWSGHYESNHRCGDAGPCHGNNCQNTLPGDTTGMGQLSAFETQNYPGVTKCRRSCRCAGCKGCTSCTPSCVWSRFAIVPQSNKVYSVNSIGQRMHSPHVTAEISFTNGTNLVISANLVNGEFKNNDFTLSIIGNLGGVIAGFDNKKVIVGSGGAFMAYASELGSPVSGNLGDIQAGTAELLSTTGTTNFIYAEGMYVTNEDDDETKYFFKTNGFDNTPKENFPIVRGSDMWIFDSGYLMSNTSNPGAIMIHFKSLMPMRISRKRDIICPKINKVVSASGCFNCDLGSSVLIEAFSSCKSGLVLLKVSDPKIQLNTNSFNLGVTPKEYSVRFKTSSRANSFILQLISGQNSASVRVEFTATELNLVRNETWINGTGHAERDVGGSDWLQNFWDSIEDVFNGIGSIWDYIKFIIVIIVGCLILYLIFVVVKFLWNYMKPSLSKALTNTKIKYRKLGNQKKM